jgi:hypothetical protein
MQFSHPEESNNSNFDYNYIKKVLTLMKQISIIRLVIQYIFIINLFGDVNANVIFYKLGQTWASLTGTLSIIAFFSGRREYVPFEWQARKRQKNPMWPQPRAKTHFHPLVSYSYPQIWQQWHISNKKVW